MSDRRGAIGILTVAAAILLLVTSCSSRKKMVSMAKAADYQWMTAKMTMDITTPGMEVNNVSGVLRMRRDSTVWISASAVLGVESIRTLVTQDSVILINRVNQTYLAEPISAIATMQVPTLQEIKLTFKLAPAASIAPASSTRNNNNKNRR